MINISVSLTSRVFIEACRIFHLAWPITLSHASYVLMGLVDTVMAGHAGVREQAIVGLGISLWIPIAALLISTLQAVSILVANHYGANDHEKVFEETRQGIWLGLGLGILPALAYPWLEGGLITIGIDAFIANQATLYMQGIIFGLPALMIFRAFTFCMASIGNPRPAMVIGFVTVFVNAGLNYVFIYGHAGFPKMGGSGCGLATGIGMWISLFMMIVYTAKMKGKANFDLYKKFSWPKLPRQIALLKIGLPMGLASLADVSAFTAVTLMIADLGITSIASHQIALNFSALVFMLPSGISISLCILVSQTVGKKKFIHAKFIAFTGLFSAIFLVIFLMLIIVVFRNEITGVYTRDPEVAKIAVTLILISVAWHISDSIQICAIGIIRGYQITFRPMLITFSAFWLVGIPLGRWLAIKGIKVFNVLPMGIFGYWVGLVIGISVAALFLYKLLNTVTSRAINKNTIY